MKVRINDKGIYFFEPDKWGGGKPEDVDQKEFAAWMKYHYPDVLWFHTPNETKGNVQHFVSRQMKGVLGGVSDNIILYPSIKGWPYAAIEHKKNASRRPAFQSGQLPFLEGVSQNGGFAAVTYGIEQLKFAANYYLDKKGIYFWTD